jgi:hypothetical protein
MVQPSQELVTASEQEAHGVHDPGTNGRRCSPGASTRLAPGDRRADGVYLDQAGSLAAFASEERPASMFFSMSADVFSPVNMLTSHLPMSIHWGLT